MNPYSSNKYRCEIRHAKTTPLIVYPYFSYNGKPTTLLKRLWSEYKDAESIEVTVVKGNN